MIHQREIILLAFPFSDMKNSKVRPVIALSNDRYNKKSDDFVAIPLTSNLKPSPYSTLITSDDLEYGRLVVDSNVRIDKIFSVDKKLARKKIGMINKKMYQKITKTLQELVGT